MPHYALMPNPTAAEREAYLKDLYSSIEGNDVPMAVVDYLGRRDADGWVGPRTCLRRRYGVRSMGHVRLYGLQVLEKNPRAWALEQKGEK